MDTFDLVEQVLERDVAAVLIGKKLDELYCLRALTYFCPPREPLAPCPDLSRGALRTAATSVERMKIALPVLPGLPLRHWAARCRA